LRSAFIHMIGDVAATVGAVSAGILIYFTHANWLDPFISVLIGFLILYSAWGILRETVDILLESTPRDVDMSAVVRDMLEVKGVIGIHDLHVWSISRGLRTMSAHVLTEDVTISAGAEIQHQLSELCSSVTMWDTLRFNWNVWTASLIRCIAISMAVVHHTNMSKYETNGGLLAAFCLSCPERKRRLL